MRIRAEELADNILDACFEARTYDRPKIISLIEAHDAEILREAADRAQAKLDWHRAHGNTIESLCIKDAITRGNHDAIEEGKA